jgi:crotonobetainyl-CoA:carnitine CoA-transferase CaiB-like acyl-CoA transferase
MSGMMSITGTHESAPLRVGFPISDSVGGLTAALAVTAALAGRQRDGLGCFLDVSMLEASISAMGWAVSNFLLGGVAPQPMGDQNPTAAPSGTFDAADGPLNIAANRQEQFERLCHCVGRPDLVTDPRFADREHRLRHREELNQQLNEALGARTALAWEQALSDVGVPAARILTVAQTVELEQLAHRDFLADVPFPELSHIEGASADGAGARRLRLTGTGVLVNGRPLHPSEAPPLLGEHNAELPEIVRRWRASGPTVVAQAGPVDASLQLSQ